MGASKKGISSKQIQRMLGVTYKTAWFMTMRLREAMRDKYAAPIGGEGKIVESDETFVGGKKKNVHKGKPEPKKHAVHALVERGGEVRAKHVADVTAKTLREAIVTQASRKSELHTDEALTYYWLGREFEKHKTVNHSQGRVFQGRRWRAVSRGVLRDPEARRSSARSTACRSSTCSATSTSSRSAGTTARRSASRTSSAPTSWSRVPLASA